MKKFVLDLIHGGSREGQGIVITSRIIVFNAFCLIGVLNLIALGTLAYVQQNVGLALFDFFVALSLASLVYYLKMTNDLRKASYCAISLVGILYYYLLFTGGVAGTAHVWYFTYPLIASFILGSTPGMIFSVALFVPALVLFAWPNPPSPFTSYSTSFKLRFIPSFIVILIFSYLFEITREKGQQKLEKMNRELQDTVTALQETEEKLIRAGEELERRVQERTEELFLTNIRLEGEMEERKRSEEALRESEGKLNAMLRSISDCMIMLDPELNLLWCNEKAKEVFHIGNDGGKCYELLCSRSQPCLLSSCYVMQTFCAGNIHSSETTLIDRQGEEIFFHCSANVAFRNADGEPSAVLAILRDITDRKEAEQEVAESERKYRTLFEDSMEAMSIVHGGKMIDVNPAWLVLHGYEDKKDVLGRDVIEFIHPEDRHILINRRATWPRHAHRSYQIRDLKKDGAVIEVEIYASKITLGAEDAILTTIRDVTEKKQSERDKKALEERLSRSEKMEALGTLAGGVAHDLNNILGGIVGYPDLILMDLPEDSPLRKGILMIQNSGEKAAAIVQDLLTLARRGVAVMGTVNLNDMIEDYLHSPEYGKLKSFHPQIRVEYHLEKDLLPISGSAVHLSKVVMNLVSNAAEAMPRGGEIKIETSNKYVDTLIRGYDQVNEGEYVVMQISDTGIGIAEKDIKKIFEPFYTKKVMGRSGTGLGMAVVWGTVKDHKGYIDIDSVEGRGTTVTLFFPVNRSAVKAEARKVFIEDYLGKGETVLVVDDVIEQREIASVMLKKLGYAVITSKGGEDAVEYMREHEADLVVLDMIMDPGIDGLETYRQIADCHPGQKAIIVSGYAETDRVKEAQRLGAGSYLKKPYTMEKIALAVRSELDSPMKGDYDKHRRSKAVHG